MASLKYEMRPKKGWAADFDDFVSFARALADSLQRTHRRLHAEERRTPRFNVVRLEIGSAIAEIAPARAKDERLISDFVSTLRTVRSGEMPSGRFPSEDIKALRRLASPLESRTAELAIGGIAIDEQFLKACDRLLESSPKALGQVVGTLDGVNVHTKHFARVYPVNQAAGAECYFPPEMYEQIVSALRRRVRITGEVKRSPDGQDIEYVWIDTLEVLPAPEEIPSLMSLGGLWADRRGTSLDEIRAGWAPEAPLFNQPA